MKISEHECSNETSSESALGWDMFCIGYSRKISIVYLLEYMHGKQCTQAPDYSSLHEYTLPRGGKSELDHVDGLH